MGTFQERMSFVFRFLQNPLIEFEPAQFAVDVEGGFEWRLPRTGGFLRGRSEGALLPFHRACPDPGADGERCGSLPGGSRPGIVGFPLFSC